MGGSSGSAAANAASQSEAWRNRNVDRAVEQINTTYGSAGRQADVDDFLGATRSFYNNELGRQKNVADRSLKFAMARNGLAGGSASVDANRTLGENYQQGVLNAERLAQGATANLRNSDEASRQNLISQVAGGLSLTSGASQSASALQNNLQAAQGGLQASNLGDVFGGLASIFTRSRESAQERRGYRDTFDNRYAGGIGFGGAR